MAGTSPDGADLNGRLTERQTQRIGDLFIEARAAAAHRERVYSATHNNPAEWARALKVEARRADELAANAFWVALYALGEVGESAPDDGRAQATDTAPDISTGGQAA